MNFTGGTFLNSGYWENDGEKILLSATNPTSGHENAYLKI
jgi:hypothetical protein